MALNATSWTLSATNRQRGTSRPRNLRIAIPPKFSSRTIQTNESLASAAACGAAVEEEETAPADTAAQTEKAAAAATGELTIPDWMTVDETAQTITLEIDAGSITVPQATR